MLVPRGKLRLQFSGSSAVEWQRQDSNSGQLIPKPPPCGDSQSLMPGLFWGSSLGRVWVCWWPASCHLGLILPMALSHSSVSWEAGSALFIHGTRVTDTSCHQVHLLCISGSRTTLHLSTLVTLRDIFLGCLTWAKPILLRYSSRD